MKWKLVPVEPTWDYWLGDAASILRSNGTVEHAEKMLEVRTALSAAPQPVVTDEMEERAAPVWWKVVGGDVPWGSVDADLRERYSKAIRAALTAALGDQG